MAVHDLIMAAAGAGGGAGPSELQFVTSAVSGVTTATQTFSSVSIGPAYTNRRFIVGFTCGASTIRTISSATFGGNAMTALASVPGVGVTAFYEISFPTGTTADIVFNLSSGSLTSEGFIAVYYIGRNSAVTVVDQQSGTSTATSKIASSLGTALNGSVLFAANQFNGTGGAATVSSISGLDATDASNSTSNTIRTFSTDLVTTGSASSYQVTFSKSGSAVDKFLAMSITGP